MRVFSFDLKLRLWAWRQCLHHFRTERHDGETPHRIREILWSAVLRGHLAPHNIFGVEEAFGGVRAAPADAAILAAAKAQLQQYSIEDAERTGVVRGYAAAQLAHLEKCASCRRYVCDVVRTSIRDLSMVDGLLRAAGMRPASRAAAPDKKTFLN